MDLPVEDVEAAPIVVLDAARRPSARALITVLTNKTMDS